MTSPNLPFSSIAGPAMYPVEGEGGIPLGNIIPAMDGIKSLGINVEEFARVARNLGLVFKGDMSALSYRPPSLEPLEMYVVRMGSSAFGLNLRRPTQEDVPGVSAQCAIFTVSPGFEDRMQKLLDDPDQSRLFGAFMRCFQLERREEDREPAATDTKPLKPANPPRPAGA